MRVSLHHKVRVTLSDIGYESILVGQLYVLLYIGNRWFSLNGPIPTFSRSVITNKEVYAPSNLFSWLLLHSDQELKS